MNDQTEAVYAAPPLLGWAQDREEESEGEGCAVDSSGAAALLFAASRELGTAAAEAAGSWRTAASSWPHPGCSGQRREDRFGVLGSGTSLEDTLRTTGAA